MTPHGMHRFPTSALAAAALGCALLLACSKEEAPPPQAQPVEQAAPVEPEPFAPPENGLLTEDQVRRFLRAHETLTAVNDLYLDSLEGAAPERRRSIHQALDIARDKATRKSGLNGYAEYRWILEEAPRHPANVRILQKMSVTTIAR